MPDSVMPQGWKVRGWAAEGEGADAVGPDGQVVMAATVEDLPAAILAHLAGVRLPW